MDALFHVETTRVEDQTESLIALWTWVCQCGRVGRPLEGCFRPPCNSDSFPPACTPWRAILTILYTHVERWNHDYFANTLFPPHFLIMSPKIAKAEADYAPISGWGSHSQIRIRPSLIDGTHPHLKHGSLDPEGIQRYWLDTALHEVVHQYCHEILGKPESAEKGHGRVYALECSRVGALMGLPPVGPARQTRNTHGLPSCSFWPTSVRQPNEIDYYLGAYRPDLDAAAKAQKAANKAQHRSVMLPTGMDALIGLPVQSLSEPLIPSPIPPMPTNPLTAREWDTLLAVRDARIRPLILKLAAHLQILPSAAMPAPEVVDAPVSDAAFGPPSQPIAD